MQNKMFNQVNENFKSCYSISKILTQIKSYTELFEPFNKHDIK